MKAAAEFMIAFIVVKGVYVWAADSEEGLVDWRCAFMDCREEMKKRSLYVLVAESYGR